MTTADDLKIEFSARFIELKQVTAKYLGWSEDFTRDKANKGLIPFRTFKAVKSNKAPWLVDAIDLANYLDKMRMGAQSPHETLQPISVEPIRPIQHGRNAKQMYRFIIVHRASQGVIIG